MLRAIVSLSVLCAAAWAATTASAGPTSMPDMTTQMNVKILYDMNHHKAMIVRDDGCYEYPMDHQDVMDTHYDSTRAVLEARMLSELAQAMDVQESGHHHIDHMTQEIRTACASLPVYQWLI